MKFFKELKHQILRHSLIIAGAVLYILLAFSIKAAHGFPLKIDTGWYFHFFVTLVLPIGALMTIFGVPIYILIIKRPAYPLSATKEAYGAIFDYRRYAKVIPVLIFMTIALSAYKESKMFINHFNPYSWDETFMRLDRLLHFGVDPWRILNPIFGSASATYTLNLLYNLWFVFLFLFWVSAGWSKDDRGWERQFLLSFILCWFLGGFVMATIFSSMGPTYYDLVDPANNPYLAQIQFLQDVDKTHSLAVLGTQDALRQAHLNASMEGIAGISAMPSLHNGTTALFVFAGYKISRPIGIIMTVFLITIMIGSVHLAWHYAVDAYVGIAVAFLCWKLAHKLIAWQDQKLAIGSTRN